MLLAYRRLTIRSRDQAALSIPTTLGLGCTRRSDKMPRPRRHGALADAYQNHIDSHPVVVLFHVVVEIRYGMRRAHWGELRVRRTERLMSEFSVGELDDATITSYVVLRLRAIEVGHPLGNKVHDGDRWLAASAVSENLPCFS